MSVDFPAIFPYNSEANIGDALASIAIALGFAGRARVRYSASLKTANDSVAAPTRLPAFAVA